MPQTTKKSTLSEVSIACFNIQGLGVGTKKGDRKLQSIIGLKSTITVVVDAHCSDHKISLLRSKFRNQMARYDIVGTNSDLRGILIFIERNSGITIDNLVIIDNSTLTFDAILADQTTVHVIGVYGPSADTPSYWDRAFELYNASEQKLKIMLGDFNVVLNPHLDCLGYVGDTHKKGRVPINHHIDNEIVFDVFRELNPEAREYTWNVKSMGKRSRLDYMLVSPTFLNNVKEFNTIHSPWDISDHAAIQVKIDLTLSKGGPGVFRCPPSIHRDITYHRLICNSIKATILENTQESDTKKLRMGLLAARIKLEEELFSLETTTLDWPTQNRKHSLECALGIILSCEPTNGELLSEPLITTYDTLLEVILSNMRDETLRYNRSKRLIENQDLSILQESLKIEKNKQGVNRDKIREIEDEINLIEEARLADTLLRNKDFELVADEKPSATFLKMESSKGYSEITRLRRPNKFFNENLPESDKNIKYTTMTDQKLIREEMKDAFQKIYNKQEGLKSSDEDLTEFMASGFENEPLIELNRRKITPTMSDSMEGLLTDSELKLCLFEKMKGSSSPGIDGFTVNHIRTFWDDLKDVTREALNYNFGNQLTKTLKVAIIRMLRKGKKDPTLTGNYRPISLLSVFYKLASCVITNRIKPAVEHIVGQQQKAYIGNNNIGSCITNLINMIRGVNTKKTNALILLIDFRKAFDSLDQEFIQTALKRLGFGKDIREWIRLFFDKREAYILLGGHLTSQIFLEQGVPQGDVVSPYIFIVIVELLLIKINYTSSITGIRFAKDEGRSETFADDTTIFMERSEANLRNCISIISHFAKISGLACNVKKTVVVPIGGNFDPKDTLCNELKLTWDTQFTILGFEIDSKLEHLDTNLLKIHDKVNRLINKWQCYKLTIIGRTTIAKVLLLSQYTYVASVLDINKDTTNHIQQILNTFVLHNCTYDPLITRKMWMNKEILYGPKQMGGLNLPKVSEFFNSLKCSWIRRYAITKVNDHWADQIDLFFNLTPDCRSDLLLWGSERFNEIVKSGIPCISG